MKKIIVFVSLLLGMSSCGFVPSKIVVDNPTDVEIEVEVGDTILAIPANSSSEIDLKNGDYEVKKDGESLGTVTIDSFGHGIINPTGYEYIYAQTYYADPSYDKYPLEDVVIELNGRKYYGPYELRSDLYIKKDWDFNLDQGFPTQVDMSQISTYKIESNIFRFEDFERDYNSFGGPTEEEIEQILSN